MNKFFDREFDPMRVLTVLALIALAGLVLTLLFAPRIYTGPGRGGPVPAAGSQLSMFGTALNAFLADTGHYPASEHGFEDLIKPPTNEPGWKGPYLNNLPLDPWGHPYQYSRPGVHNTNSYDLLSIGPDGVRGTPDDIVNWIKGAAKN